MNPNTIAGLWLALVALMGTCLYLAHRLYRANPGAVVADNDAGELSAMVEKLDGELFDARTANASLAADVRRLTDENTELRGLYNLALRAVPVAGDRGHVATAGEADDVFNGQAWRKQ